MPEAQTAVPRVVVLRDGRWPDVPGVCCWRHSVREAFAAAGADVQDVDWRAPIALTLPGSDSPARRQFTWLPPRAARAVRGVLDDSRRRIRRFGSRRAGDRRRPVPGLDGAALVIAESIDAARAAVSGGAPRHRVWAFVAPPERTYDGAAGYGADPIAEAAPLIGGFLTDSELGRESIERAAAAAARPAVVVFPPLAVDRICPLCTTDRVQRDLDIREPTPAQLAAWRGLIEQQRSGERVVAPYSFPAARVRGLHGPWQPADRPDWAPGAQVTPLRLTGEAPPEPWSGAAQHAGARAALDAVGALEPLTPRPVRDVLVTGFDLKFVRELAERLDRRSDLKVTVDEWPALSKATHRTTAAADRAQAIVAEWARPSAVWLSKRKRGDQTLVVRLHRYELTSPYPRDIAIENVDAVIYIAPLVGRRIRDELGWPADKLVYIPNFVDVDWLDRPKLPDARFAIGLVGMVPTLKRLDLALDLLALVRRQDPRFTLVIRSAMPWTNEYVWRKPEERDYYGWCLERLGRDPLLRDGVMFDPPGRDMARWFRRVGHVVSASDIEGSHTSVAEGMASGAVPVVRDWAGAADIYADEWIHSSLEEAAGSLLAAADHDAWAARSARAKAEIRRTHDPDAVVAAWADLLHGDREQAKAGFAPYSGLDAADTVRAAEPGAS